jgi:endonuclease/exonuclease/phosphatase family metal-dependent hydrolase
VDRRLRIASFNAENFYLLLDRDYRREELEALDDESYLAMNPSIYNPNKPRAKVAAIAQTILDRDYDLVGLCEVGGMESLSNLNRIYLGGRYDCYLHEENSRRGIYVGALVRKGVFSHVEAESMPGAFSRNLLRLRLGRRGSDLEAYIVHLKSQYGEDHGIGQRMREVGLLSSLVRRERCLVMGDFNGILIRGESQFEYDAFLSLPFRDVLEAVGIPPERRWTHYHFSPRPNFAQLDYIFCSDDIAVDRAGVVEGQIPMNRAQRFLLPSDHLFIEADIVPPADPTRAPEAAVDVGGGGGPRDGGGSRGRPRGRVRLGEGGNDVTEWPAGAIVKAMAKAILRRLKAPRPRGDSKP